MSCDDGLFPSRCTIEAQLALQTEWAVKGAMQRMVSLGFEEFSSGFSLQHDRAVKHRLPFSRPF